ncbi:uncharacterized protein BDR25DRAFT_268714 [Lindgomyces ingoldianus]|uniref:Uncharacterized protein n=1 Tax=Lindgomyces ingoldianus TaxID=673940 RepID=A0ACB6QIY3_9PLEO|nr:uncharacterized protein BDR25DRAFT_268714 [Lindgomyces ingoldianus]KAF2466287.1 hypothetical protein BDR25DRAFT_268714 [Lindgomyces ingoldianus]
MNMQATPSTPFRFMDLPPELRDMVYEYLLEDPYYPPPPASEKKQISPLSWIMSSRTGRASVGGRPEARKSNWVFLVNRQVYTEYMDLLCKKTVFRLTVSPANYPKDIQSITSEPLPGSQKPRIWRIAPETLQQVKRCDLKLITTSSMLGVPDPRNMTPASWGLAKQVREELKEVKNVHELNLHVKAIGDPLWNPLWVWYHASQAFKNTLVLTPTSTYSPSLSSTYTPSPPQPLGPKLNRITFSLDTWSPGENYLSRDADGKWAWWCMAGHCVGFDGEGGMTVREFCARLYADCVTCRPESSGENEDEDV